VHGVSWERYEAMRELLDTPSVRMTYLEGTLELMSPLRLHEHSKKLIARLVEAYAFERGLPLQGYGSTTFRKRAKERGAEPDECYMLGTAPPLDDNRTPPHIALEVVITHSDIDKLSVYSGLQVPELWLWDGERFTLHGLEGDEYVALSRSRFLPDLDLELLARYVNQPDQAAAVRAFIEQGRRG
jgi:Uma2 family endonuclease